MKKYEFEIRFEDKYYNIVRSIVNNYYNYKLFSRYDGKGIFKSNIIVKEEHNGYTNIWFKCISDKIILKLCKRDLYDLEKFKIIKIVKEPK